ncbi:uncharacterized protein JCM6883_001392 [Sporobolomyces salmoneus]|uniref:uncharacterized protein n=1 Tax=Sporobolomyces salmoneus TaxID=183962 RepID=UPI0031775328
MSAYYTATPNDPPRAQPSASLHQSSFHNLTLEHSLEDLSARFIVNLPAEELESMDRVCFQIEQAHWYYEDFIRPAALNPGLLPSYGLKAFSLLMFRSCPLLHDLLPNHNKIWNSFMAYKERVPVCGAIIISEYWDKVLLVKGWTKGSSWSFPRGKINKEEPEAMCAVREVLEETGFDMTEYFHPSQFQPGHVEDEGSERIPYYVELVIKEQKIRLYFIPGVREDTVFETRTRKEISKIEWFKLNDLPTWGKDKKGRTTRTKAQLEGRQAKFYMVTPFISHLKLWIDHHKPKNLPIRPVNELSPLSNEALPLPSSPPFDGDDLHDDPTYHLPSEIELGDSTSAEADSTEDENDDFLNLPPPPQNEPVSFETTQQGTEALTALFFGSPPTSSNPLPLSPPSRSQSFEVASTPPLIAYERQSSFLQPKPQNAMNQQTKLLELLSGAVPSPPPPPPPVAPQQYQQQYSEPPTRSTESRSLLHLLNDVNLSCDSPTTPQDSTPQHPSPSQQPHAILFSNSQAPPEAREFGQPLPAHLKPDRNDTERKEKHNALLRALLSVATRPTPPQPSGDDLDTPPTPTSMRDSYQGSNGWTTRENSQPPGAVRESELGKNGIPYGPDEDDEVWPPRVLRRNQLYPLETPQSPEIVPPPLPVEERRYEPQPTSLSPISPNGLPPILPQVVPEPPRQNGGGGLSLLSILNGNGGERAPTNLPTVASPESEPRAKDPLELLREHRARQLGQDPTPTRVESHPAPPVLPSPTHVHPPLPVPPQQPPLSINHVSAPSQQQFSGMQPHYYLPPPPGTFPSPVVHPDQPQFHQAYPAQGFLPPSPAQQILQHPPRPIHHSLPPAPPQIPFLQPSTQFNHAPAPLPNPTRPPPVQTTTVPPQAQVVPSFADFPPLGSTSKPSTTGTTRNGGAGSGKSGNAGALLGFERTSEVRVCGNFFRLSTFTFNSAGTARSDKYCTSVTSLIKQAYFEGRPEALQGTISLLRIGIDHLSRLPVELLDAIFEVANSDFRRGFRLTTRAISKTLLLSQERSIYQTIILDSAQILSRLVCTFVLRPDKGRHVKRLVGAWHMEPKMDGEEFLRHLPNLVEMEFNGLEGADTLQFLRQPRMLPSLRICRFPDTSLDALMVDCLSRIPTLRFVEVSLLNGGKDKNTWMPARQILQVALRSQIHFRVPGLSNLLHCFPSASIPSVIDDSVLPFLEDLGPSLRSLQLRSCDYDRLRDSIDHLLPRFPNLQDLHLDPPFVSENLQESLLQLSNLSTLGIAYHRAPPNLDELCGGLARLPLLRTLTLEYLGIRAGQFFDFVRAEAEEEFKAGSYYAVHFSLLNGATELCHMGDWRLPWHQTTVDILPQVMELEEKARAAGLAVRSNLSELLRVFRLQIVELYNRAVGDLYFYGLLDPLGSALSLAQRHGLDVDRLRIDLAEEFDIADLEWFEDETEIPGSGQGKGDDRVRIYGLRMKTESGQEEEEEEEEERDESESSL